MDSALPNKKSAEQELVDFVAGWLPRIIRPYAVAMAAFLIGAGCYWLALQAGVPARSFPGRLISAVFVLIYVLVIAGSAWLGYGVGLVTCVLSTILLAVAFPHRTGAPAFDAIRFALLVFISLLVSLLAESQRRRETELIRAAEELERRVEERSAEAVRSRESAEKALDEAKEQAQLLDLAHDAILSMDANGAIRFWSRGAEAMYGYSSDEALGQVSHQLLQTVAPEPMPQILDRLARQGHWEGELTHIRKDGARLTIASRWAARYDHAAHMIGFLEINTDVTQRRQLEEKLRHTQKLESLGVLAGGVAHDFNNLLTGILGNASLALDYAGPGSPARAMIEDIVKASERAADLTRQLLAYAGKGRFVLRTIDLSELVREISALMQTSFPPQVQFRLQLAAALPGIEADPGQVQQIVMNLVLNGAEAIGPEGGSVLVRTSAQEVDDAYIHAMGAHGELLRPGRYVALEVHDTGQGMSAETAARIFDPFFTTKFAGRGLGLSAVQGIVRSHKGALRVYSKPGQGSTFKVLFPASTVAPAPRVPDVARDLRGSATVMVVDDEDLIRHIARNTLERYGYRTVLAADGPEAIHLFREHSGEVDLVLLDMTMPAMGGEETLQRLRELDPTVRVLLTSGYNELEATQRFAAHGLAGFLQKPFTANALAEKIKAALE